MAYKHAKVVTVTAYRKGETMTKTQKDTLRDCFEGCFGFRIALGMAGINEPGTAFDDAWRTWRRWETEMDEEGSYTF